MNPRTVLLLISGTVQGVFYRKSTQTEALRLGLCGYVRNLDDGRVEVLATGPDVQLAELIAWCHHGPRGARVTDVAVSEAEPTELVTFVIRR